MSSLLMQPLLFRLILYSYVFASNFCHPLAQTISFPARTLISSLKRTQNQTNFIFSNSSPKIDIWSTRYNHLDRHCQIQTRILDGDTLRMAANIREFVKDMGNFKLFQESYGYPFGSLEVFSDRLHDKIDCSVPISLKNVVLSFFVRTNSMVRTHAQIANQLNKVLSNLRHGTINEGNKKERIEEFMRNKISNIQNLTRILQSSANRLRAFPNLRVYTSLTLRKACKVLETDVFDLEMMSNWSYENVNNFFIKFHQFTYYFSWLRLIMYQFLVGCSHALPINEPAGIAAKGAEYLCRMMSVEILAQQWTKKTIWSFTLEEETKSHRILIMTHIENWAYLDLQMWTAPAPGRILFVYATMKETKTRLVFRGDNALQIAKLLPLARVHAFYAYDFVSPKRKRYFLYDAYMTPVNVGLPTKFQNQNILYLIQEGHNAPILTIEYPAEPPLGLSCSFQVYYEPTLDTIRMNVFQDPDTGGSVIKTGDLSEEMYESILHSGWADGLKFLFHVYVEEHHVLLQEPFKEILYNFRLTHTSTTIRIQSMWNEKNCLVFGNHFEALKEECSFGSHFLWFSDLTIRSTRYSNICLSHLPNDEIAFNECNGKRSQRWKFDSENRIHSLRFRESIDITDLGAVVNPDRDQRDPYCLTMDNSTRINAYLKRCDTSTDQKFLLVAGFNNIPLVLGSKTVQDRCLILERRKSDYGREYLSIENAACHQSQSEVRIYADGSIRFRDGKCLNLKEDRHSFGISECANSFDRLWALGSGTIMPASWKRCIGLSRNTTLFRLYYCDGYRPIQMRALPSWWYEER